MPGEYTIGALARQVGVNVETIRYYQRRGLMGEPARPRGGIRRYGQKHARLRLTFRRNRAELLQTVEYLIELDPQRIILSHGRWYANDGARELRRAFRWLLPNS